MTGVTKYYQALGRKVAVRQAPDASGASSSSLVYLLADHLGSTVGVIDAVTGAATRQQYWPYGATRSGAVTQTDKLYAGQQQEPGGDPLGLYNYRARFYSTALGRFVSADTATADGLNRYAYVRGNPLRYTDPTGHGVTNDDGTYWRARVPRGAWSTPPARRTIDPWWEQCAPRPPCPGPPRRTRDMKSDKTNPAPQISSETMRAARAGAVATADAAAAARRSAACCAWSPAWRRRCDATDSPASDPSRVDTSANRGPCEGAEPEVPRPRFRAMTRSGRTPRARRHIAVWMCCIVAGISAACGSGGPARPSETPTRSSIAATLRSLLLNASDLGASWTEETFAGPFAGGVGPCEPQRAPFYLAEAHVGYSRGSALFLEAAATFPTAEAAERILQRERTSLASCGPGSGMAQIDLALGDSSFGYTQRIGDQLAVIALIRVGTLVLNVDYADNPGTNVDLAAVRGLLKIAVERARTSGYGQ